LRTANLYIAAAPIYSEDGGSQRSGFTILFRDITREKSLEEERNEFISVVSHELRTPIAVIEGYVANAEYMLTKTNNIPDTAEAIKKSHEQILFLASMINDLSTLSRAEDSTQGLEIEVIEVPALVESLAASYSSKATAKGISFDLQLDPHVAQVHSNQVYVTEILQNFLTNAIKFTEKGSITLSVRTTPDGRGVSFSVADTGIGISKSDKQRVFDKFFRSEDFRTRKTNGTGLGLYIALKVARLINAHISLSSELDKGTTFTVIVPDLGAENSTKTPLPPVI
jgi:signal transduction histidine kinase